MFWFFVCSNWIYFGFFFYLAKIVAIFHWDTLTGWNWNHFSLPQNSLDFFFTMVISNLPTISREREKNNHDVYVNLNLSVLSEIHQSLWYSRILWKIKIQILHVWAQTDIWIFPNWKAYIFHWEKIFGSSFMMFCLFVCLSHQ